MADIAARRQEAETRLTELKHRHGIALLDGKTFDLAEMMDVERELSGLEAAEGEMARRARLETVTAEQARIAGLRQKLHRIDSDRLDAADKAERAARDLCSALRLWIACNTDAARIVRALKGGGAGLLDPTETEMRISHMLGSALKPLFGNRRKLGQISFFTILDRYSGSWRKLERDATDNEIQTVLKGTDA